MVRDFSRYAIDLYGKATTNEKQMEACMKMISKPVVDQAKFDKVLKEHVYSLANVYEMSE